MHSRQEKMTGTQATPASLDQGDGSTEESKLANQTGNSKEDGKLANQTGNSKEDGKLANQTGNSKEDGKLEKQTGTSKEDGKLANQTGNSKEDGKLANPTGNSKEPALAAEEEVNELEVNELEINELEVNELEVNELEDNEQDEVNVIRDYSKSSRVDEQQLKHVMLSIIQRLIAEKENKTKDEGVQSPQGSISFVDIYREMFKSDELHLETQEDLTVHMAFYVLMSIASENSLKIKNDATGDIVVSYAQENI